MFQVLKLTNILMIPLWITYFKQIIENLMYLM